MNETYILPFGSLIIAIAGLFGIILFLSSKIVALQKKVALPKIPIKEEDKMKELVPIINSLELSSKLGLFYLMMGDVKVTLSLSKDQMSIEGVFKDIVESFEEKEQKVKELTG